MAVGISFDELLRYEEEQTELWRDFFHKRHHLLKLEASPTESVGGLLLHIFTAEYRSAERLLGEPMTPDSEFKNGNVDELFAVITEAHRKLRQYLSVTTESAIAEPRTYPSHTLGEFTATPRKLLTHALVHSIRHWAQVARLLRENGQPADFSHDVLFSKAIS
jgi:uncharacterized damage-inducible protein DinB